MKTSIDLFREDAQIDLTVPEDREPWVSRWSTIWLLSGLLFFLLASFAHQG